MVVPLSVQDLKIHPPVLNAFSTIGRLMTTSHPKSMDTLAISLTVNSKLMLFAAAISYPTVMAKFSKYLEKDEDIIL
jgi:hypothetical protein